MQPPENRVVRAVSLAFHAAGSGPPLVILHGFLGSGRNWQSVARQLSGTHRVFTLDLRNHGTSPHSPEMTYPALATDVGAFLDSQGIDRARVLGHSMGGKAAMWLALTQRDRVEKLIVVDIAPVCYAHDYAAIIHALRSLPLGVMTSRQAAEAELARSIPDPRLRQFLLQNLIFEDRRYRWRIDLDILERAQPALASFPDTEYAAPFSKPTLFIAGAESDYLLPEHQPEIGRLFPLARMQTVSGAGHWPQVDQPGAFLSVVREFLSGEG
jgi:esterase